MIDHFSNEVIEKIDHYVYRLVDLEMGQHFMLGKELETEYLLTLMQWICLFM